MIQTPSPVWILKESSSICVVGTNIPESPQEEAEREQNIRFTARGQ